MPIPPPNAYKEGTKLTVGSHNISIIKYISEGGFAHVYTCKVHPPFNGSDIACLKRVVVPSKWQLTLLRQEVDAMRRLRGNSRIVSYIDSHASRLNNVTGDSSEQQYEVFLLMEYCENNGLIDFMNTRLVHKLTEPEILTIMYDVAIGVAMCHHLKPPLIHRDIKIENVLIDIEGNYKLCDFGSAVPYIPAPKTSQELQIVREDLMQNTTPQYRAPEMIDLSKGFPIDDKSDIWALGCFLYKLCYYTTPFESPHQKSLQDMEKSILHCSETLRFRDQPGSMFSSRLKNIIKCCLREDPRRRPSALQLLGEICSMKGLTTIPNVIPYSVRESQVKQLTITKTNEEKASVLPNRATDKIKDIVRESRGNVTSKSTDPFASIDKSRFLISQSSPKLPSENFHLHSHQRSQLPIRSKANIANDRPLSSYMEDAVSSRHNVIHSTSSTSLKDYVQRQLNMNNEDHEATNISDNAETGTLEFLRTKEEESKSSTSRQNTGGSLKASFKNGLRKISTGGSSIHSISSANSGSNGSNKAKRSSISSMKQLISGNSFRRASGSPEETIDKVGTGTSQEELPVRKLSIQRRMQLLLNKDKGSIPKTAHGYGKYTETAVDDIAAINNRQSDESIDTKNKSYGKLAKLQPPKIPLSLQSHKEQAKSFRPNGLNVSQAKIVPVASNAKDKKKPPKPKKPHHLKTQDYLDSERRLSNTSDVSFPDLDDLEKSFSKRFPSYV